MIPALSARAILVVVGMAAAMVSSCGCKVGPNYKAPHVETPESFTNAKAPTTGPTTSPITRPSLVDTQQAPWIDWWTKFGDRELGVRWRRITSWR